MSTVASRWGTGKSGRGTRMHPSLDRLKAGLQTQRRLAGRR
jgi:hypothetical protein